MMPYFLYSKVCVSELSFTVLFYLFIEESLKMRPDPLLMNCCSPPPGHGGGLFRYNGCSLPGVDKARKVVFFFLPQCLTRAYSACDVDENFWSDPDQRPDAEEA